MILGSDGLEYEDLKARLLGRPADNFHNQKVRTYSAGADPDHHIWKDWIVDWSRTYRWNVAQGCGRAEADAIAVACANTRYDDRRTPESGQ